MTRIEDKTMNLPIRESSSSDEMTTTTTYSNGYKRISIRTSKEDVDLAHGSDYLTISALKRLQPDYTNELLSDTPDLHLASFHDPDLSRLYTEEDKDTAVADSFSTHSFRSKGKLYNGLHVYDRKEIERETKNKGWDPIIWGMGGNYHKIMRDTARRMERDMVRGLELPLEHIGRKFSNFSDATNAASISMASLKHKFEIFHDSARERIRDFYEPPAILDELLDGPRPRRAAGPYRSRIALCVANGPEEKARVLLHRMIGPAAFRGYIRNGFVTYRGASGRIYQIFPGTGMCNVWKNGQPVEKLCLVFQDGKLPPTDSVVMRLLMLDNDEAEFSKMAVRYSFTPPRARYTEPLVEVGRIARMAERKKQLVA